MDRFVQRALRLARRQRVTGRPASANRASSFHLWWDLPPSRPLVEISAVLEVVVPPAVDDLYFWALQVDFVDGPAHLGGGHTGLQWNVRHPGRTAVNWGGYATADRGGAELEGSYSALPGLPGDANTRNFPWQSHHPYRLLVWPAPENPGAWRAEISDQTTGESTVIRDLYAKGSRLAHPVVWSEVFADCDAPSVTVRWTELRAVDEDGVEVRPAGVRVNYQRYEDGGCSNTTVVLDEEGGLRQITGAPRTTPQGTVIPL